MALIHVLDDKVAVAVTGLATDGRWGFTSLGAKEGRVYAVPDLLLEEMKEANLPCRVLTECELPEVLNQMGLDYYRNLKEHRPELLTFDLPVPPHGMRALQFHIPESKERDLPQITAILEAAGAVEIANKPTVLSLGEFELDNTIKVSCWIPEGARDTLLHQLADAKLAGFSRGTQIMVTDGFDIS